MICPLLDNFGNGFVLTVIGDVCPETVLSISLFVYIDNNFSPGTFRKTVVSDKEIRT